MVIVLGVLLMLTIVTIVLLVYLLGFRLGGQSWFAEMHRVRAQAATAERELHQLTRAAFVAMAEETEKRRKTRE